MSLSRHVPNFITLLNLMAGSIAVIHAVEGNLIMAAVFVAVGIIFDFLDGMAARLLDVKSELGLQLDSLADVVTSGVVPGIVMFQLLRRSLPGDTATNSDWSNGIDLLSWDLPLLPLVGLFITLASAYRLAKFNIDDRQTDSFIGLPTPANAMLVLSLPLLLAFQPQPWVLDIVLNPWFLVGLTLLSCYLLNAEIPLFALKFKTWGFAENKIRYLFIVLCLILIALLHFLAIPLIIIIYVLLSLLSAEKNARKKRGFQ